MVVGSMIQLENQESAVMLIPANADVEITLHHFKNKMSQETLGLMAKDLLEVPVTLMTDIKHEYDDILSIAVYHLGQDGRLEKNLRATAGLSHAFDVFQLWEGDVVIAFLPLGMVV
jgi:hypothetical protein